MSTKWYTSITNIQANILEGLASYKFLTLRQLLVLNVGTNQYAYLWKQMVALRDRPKPLVKENKFSTLQPNKGRVESLYYLTKRGKDALINQFSYREEQIKFQKGSSIAYRDYFHRKAQIDFQIAINSYCQRKHMSVDFWHSYFDFHGMTKGSKTLKALTRIDISSKFYFIPDAIFSISNSNKHQLYAFEMCNGNDTKRILEQIDNHAKAFVNKRIQNHFKLDPGQPYFILFLFSHPGTLKAVLRRANASPRLKKLLKYFYFQNYDHLQDPSFFLTWKSFDNQQQLKIF